MLTMKDASNQTSITLSEQGKRLKYKFVQVERDGSFSPVSDDELTEVEHLLAEPRIEKDFVDGVLNFETENTGKCLTYEGFPCPVDYQQLNADSEALDFSSIRQEREDSKFDFLDGMLQGVDEVHLHNAIEDYLLDTEFSEKVLDYAPCEGPHLGSLNGDSFSQTLNKTGRGAVEISKSAIPTISVPESVSYPKALDKMTMRELQETYKSTFGRETSAKDKPWLKRHILYGLQNLAELANVSRVLESGISSNENEGNLIFTCTEDSSGRVYHSARNGLANKTKRVGQGVEKRRSVCRDVSRASSFSSRNGHGSLNSGDREPSLTQKRLRKPTRRYIEESSDLKSRSCSGRLEISITNSRAKLKRARSQNRYHRKGLGATPLVYRQDAPRGSSIQVPFALHVRKGRLRKNASVMGHDSEDSKEDSKDDSEPSPQESQYDMSDDSNVSDDSVTRGRSKNGGPRRKLHRLWSLSEVQTLVDGVSQYGVGRWTEIKRVFFSTSAHRTSVDLKDKWRNLLRASSAQLHSKREMQVEQGANRGTLPIPHSVLGRVSELAIIHPYPRERKFKLVRATPVSVPTASTTCSDSSVCHNGRVVYRKDKLGFL